MKRNLFHIFAVAAAAVAFAACSADSDIDSPRPDEGYTITLRTDGIIGDTRTEFDPAINQIKWSALDQAVFYSNGIGRTSVVTLVDDGKFAEFKLSGMRPDMQEDRTRTIQGFYPVEARWNDGHQRDENNQITAFALNLKSRQEAPSTTFDPQADILVAENLQIELADEEREKKIENVRFGRPVAITEIKYVITNSTLVASNEQVRSITLHVENPDKDKYLAGNFYFNPGTFRYVDVDGNDVDTDNSYFFDSARASSVQVMLSDNPAVSSDFTAWVVTAPIALTAGDTLEFTIRTTAGTVISKTVEVNKTVAFSNTRRNTLTVNIDNTATVTSGTAPVIADGYYVIATDNYMMTSDLVNNQAFDKMDLPDTYIDGKLDVSEDKAIWYIEQAADGSYIISSKLNGKFINTSDSEQSNCALRDDAISLKIQPADGVAGKYNISINKDAGNILAYDSTYSRFAFYAQTSSMIENLRFIPVYVDSTPSFKLLKTNITVSAAGDYTEKDVYQLRNAAAANILIDVDGTVVTSASIADAAVKFTVAEAETKKGWINLNFNGRDDRIAIVVTPGPSTGGTATLSSEEIKTKFSSHTYAAAEESYLDENDGVTWTFRGSKDTATRPWLQLKNDNNAYIKIAATASIKTVTLSISNTSNSKGGIEDITKHGKFTGSISLKKSTSDSGNVGTGSDTGDDKSIAITVTEDNCKTLYITASGATRIWQVDITTGD